MAKTTPLPPRVSTLEEMLDGSENNISIIALVDALIAEAHAFRASDIHIDPALKEVRVRLRVDGVLQDSFSIPTSIHGEVVSRIKVLSNLRTDEHQAAQDGRIRHLLPDGEQVDIRVSVVPTYHGETIVLRLLSSHKAEDFTLGELWLWASLIKKRSWLPSSAPQA
jgi:type II secretory ATPase GspE/PulE/Tfp pilus assembly ATPase PilB-like protein